MEKLNEVEGRDRSAGATEEDHHAAGAEDFEGLVEGGLAYGVVDGVEAGAGGEGLNFCSEVFVGVEDDFVGSGFAGELSLFFVRDGSEDTRSEGLGHLGEQETDASGTGVDENLIARVDGIGRVRKVMGGHALKYGGSGLLCSDGFGDGDEGRGGSHCQLGIGSGDVTPDNAVSGFERRGREAWLAESDDGSGCLLTENVGEFGGVTAFTEIDIDEIDSAGFDADKSLAWAGGWRGKIAKGENVGGSGGENLDGLHGCWMLSYEARLWTVSRMRRTIA